MKTFKMMSILAILFACFVSSCSKDDSTNNPLVGHWYFTSNSDYADNSIEFKADGKGIWYDGDYEPIKYTYDEESQTLSIIWSEDGSNYDSYSEVNWDNFKNVNDVYVFSVKFNGDIMQWLDHDDGSYSYGTLRRVDKFPYHTLYEDD